MANINAEYRLTPKARDDMEVVWQHSLSQWGVAQTERYIDDLVAAFVLLAQNPKAGRNCDSIRQGYRRHSVIRHVIYCRTTDYGIEVMRVLRDRMLPSRHL